MIARIWHGWTAPADADAYEEFLRSVMFPSMERVAGFRAAELLRREDGDEVAFITITRFDSLDAVREFAGEEYERAVIEPQAKALLSRHDERSEHYWVAIADR